MARGKDKSPVERDESGLIGPFAVPDATGLGVVIPSPLSAGKPQREPDERWTLGPDARKSDAPDGPPAPSPSRENDSR
jgi:hypothetical protein